MDWNSTKFQYFLSFFCFCLFTFIISQPAYAIDSMSLAYGSGKPNDLKGGRIALQWDWKKPLLKGNVWELGGYWDVSGAYWDTNGDRNNKHKSLAAFAAAPIFRLSFPGIFATDTVTPYLEASVGATYLTQDKLGRRDLGANFAFQDLLGAGLAFGPKQRFDISYHFLHYSNAGLWEPNEGIDVKVLLMLRFHFA